MTWTYNPTEIATSKLFQVRYLVGDTVSTDKQVQDEEINFALTQRNSIYGAAAIVCRSLAARFSRDADTVDRDLRTMLSSKAKSYAQRARDFEVDAKARSGAMPYAGGISIADKIQQELDLDRVPPGFQIEMDTNYLPVAPVGNEGTPLETTDNVDEDNV